MSAITHDGRTLRMLTLIDEYTRECLAIRVARRLGRYEVIEALADVMLLRESRNTFGRTMAQSSWPKNCGSGWRRWAPGRCTSNRESLGERLLRKLQRKVARRMLERRNFLFAERGTGGDREVAGDL